jgi:hypothetical protein
MRSTLAMIYTAGWIACLNGEDGRYTNPYHAGADPEAFLAWGAGFCDAMDSEDGEKPDPASVGYHD